LEARQKILQILRAICLGVLAVPVTIIGIDLVIHLALPSAPREPTPVRPTGILSAVADSQLAWIFPASSEGRVWSGTLWTEVRTDRLGLRNPPGREETGPAKRIVVLGDSYAFGWGVAEKDAFPRQLERMIRETYPDVSVEVVNAGVPGYGFYQQRAVLERVASDAPVDVVITTLSLANDGVDDLRIARFAPDRLKAYSPGLIADGTTARRIIDGSRFLTMLDWRTSAIQFKIVNACSPAVRAMAGCLDELLHGCEATGARALMVILPQRTEVASTGPRAWIATAMAASARREAARIAGEHGVLGIDATETLRAVHAQEGAYLPNDPHWTSAGHAAVARLIREALPPEWLLDHDQEDGQEPPAADAGGAAGDGPDGT
jgi:hypothetical protein